MRTSSRQAGLRRLGSRPPRGEEGTSATAGLDDPPVLPGWIDRPIQVSFRLIFLLAVSALATLRRLHLAWVPRIFQDIVMELANREGPDLTWIAEDLAIGGQVRPDEWEAIAAAGIRAVVDCRAEGCDPADVLEAHDLAFLHLPTPDAGSFQPEQVAAGIAWIEQQLAAGRPTFIHCRAGRGRSVMLGAAVLTRRGLSPDEALAWVRARRPIVTPTPGQIARLREFAAGTGSSPGETDSA